MKKFLPLLVVLIVIMGFHNAFAQNRPTVSWTDPRPGKNDVGVENNIHIYFDMEMDNASINNQKIQLHDDDNDIWVDGTAGLVAGDQTHAGFFPTNKLNYSTRFTCVVDSTVKSVSGQTMDQNYEFSFTTTDIFGNSDDGGSGGGCFLMSIIGK